MSEALNLEENLRLILIYLPGIKPSGGQHSVRVLGSSRDLKKVRY